MKYLSRLCYPCFPESAFHTSFADSAKRLHATFPSVPRVTLRVRPAGQRGLGEDGGARAPPQAKST